MTRDELIAALENSDGPSRELDAEIHAIAFDPPHNRYWEPNWEGRAGIVGIGPYFCQCPEVAPFTGLVDAFIPGAEKLNWRIYIFDGSAGEGKKCQAEAWKDGVKIANPFANTEPLARRIAEIKALVK